MSAVELAGTPALPGRVAPVRERRRPTAVQSPERRRRRGSNLALAIVAVGVVLAVSAVRLVIGVALAEGAFELDKLRTEQRSLDRDQQVLSEQLVRSESPQYLAENAEALGMVPNANPVFLRLSDGAVLGSPAPAAGGAAASSELVPNSLIAGMPLVTGEKGATTSGGIPADAPTTPAAGAPPIVDALPTPTTH